MNKNHNLERIFFVRNCVHISRMRKFRSTILELYLARLYSFRSIASGLTSVPAGQSCGQAFEYQGQVSPHCLVVFDRRLSKAVQFVIYPPAVNYSFCSRSLFHLLVIIPWYTIVIFMVFNHFFTKNVLINCTYGLI